MIKKDTDPKMAYTMISLTWFNLVYLAFHHHFQRYRSSELPDRLHLGNLRGSVRCTAVEESMTLRTWPCSTTSARLF